MDTRARLLNAALSLLEQDGESRFTTRAACERAGVTAPTLYHHFGDADGLLSAAVELGFEQFLARKKALKPINDPVDDLLSGWDDYVAFARDRPRLYAAMTARVLAGAKIEAAESGRALLAAKIERLAKLKRLALSSASAADLVWATAHAAAMLYVAAAPDRADAKAVAALRTSATSAVKS